VPVYRIIHARNSANIAILKRDMERKTTAISQYEAFMIEFEIRELLV